MKKVLFFIISLMLVFSLFSCVEETIPEDDRQVPVYEGMTVSSISQNSGKETLAKSKSLKKELALTSIIKTLKGVDAESSNYYADLGEEIFITIHINNPDNFEILSFTLNGEKYSSYMFERGSDMENIIIKCNVGRESGEHNYTIDAIKYVDKSAIKDVIIRGNKTIKVVVSEYEYEANCKHDDAEKITVFEAKSATCDQDGLTEGKKCGKCNTVFIPQEVVPKLECVSGEWIIDKQATPTRDGLRHTECTLCGKRIKEEVIYTARSQGLEYKVNDDGVSCTVIGIGSCTDEILFIPEYIDGYKVTEIGDSAFYECGFKKVVLSQYIVKIGNKSFMKCKQLEEITIPASFKSVGDEGFYMCDLLKTVYYQGDIEGWCSVVFGDTWGTPLGRSTRFYINDELIVNLVIPDTVTKINDQAFFGCDYIQSVVIGNGVVEIGDQAFSWCESLSDIVLGNSVKIIDDCAFEGTPITSIVIPDSVESIGYEAFMCCRSLKTVVMGNNATHVKTGVFLECPAIEYNEFKNGRYLGTKDNPYYLLVSVIDKSATSIEIADGVKAIVGGAFSQCFSLESITIPDGITNFERFMFQDCTSLTTIVIPKSLTFINDYAFHNCASLESIIIPDSVTVIEPEAFINCTSLTVYCEATSKPEGWKDGWDYTTKSVVWGYSEN